MQTIVQFWRRCTMENEVLFEYRDRHILAHHTRTPHPEPDHHSFRSHSHNMAELYCFISGNARFAVEGQVYNLAPGTVLLMGLGQTHNILLENDQTYERIAVLLDSHALPPQYEAYKARLLAGERAFLIDSAQQIWWKESFEILTKTAPEHRADLLISFFAMAITQLLGRDNISLPEWRDDIVYGASRYIDEHLAEEMNLDDIAGAIFTNKTALNRKFRSVMGCSVWEYVLRKRIHAARGQLYLSRSVRAAFESSGFGDYSSFYRAYKKYIGCSPTEDMEKSK